MKICPTYYVTLQFTNWLDEIWRVKNCGGGGIYKVYYTSPALTKIKINMKLYPARLILILKNFPFLLKVLESSFNILT